MTVGKGMSHCLCSGDPSSGFISVCLHRGLNLCCGFGPLGWIPSSFRMGSFTGAPHLQANRRPVGLPISSPYLSKSRPKIRRKTLLYSQQSFHWTAVVGAGWSGKGRPWTIALWPEHPRICRVCWEEAIFSSPLQKSSSWYKVLCDLFLSSEAPSSCFSLIPVSQICLFSLTDSLFSPICPPCPLLFSSHLDKPRGLASCQGGSTTELADHHGRTSQLNLQGAEESDNFLESQDIRDLALIGVLQFLRFASHDHHLIIPTAC